MNWRKIILVILAIGLVALTGYFSGHGQGLYAVIAMSCAPGLLAWGLFVTMYKPFWRELLAFLSSLTVFLMFTTPSWWLLIGMLVLIVFLLAVFPRKH
ncbi:MAG: hypothetical protein ACXVDB_05815 [Tumebacillaceae bacterium]